MSQHFVYAADMTLHHFVTKPFFLTAFCERITLSCIRNFRWEGSVRRCKGPIHRS